MDGFKRNRLRELFSITKLITIFEQKIAPDFIFPGEHHDFWEFIYADRGEVMIGAEGTEYLLKSGEMAFHKPGEFHTVRSNGRVTSKCIIVSFETRSAGMQFFENKILFPDDDEKELLHRALDESRGAFSLLSEKPPVMGMRRKPANPPGSEQAVKIYLELLLIHIYRRRDAITRSKRYVISPLKLADRKLAENIQAYLERNTRASVTLEEISREMNVSVSKVKKTFRSETGSGIIECFNRLKIEEAKQMLSQGEYTITRISELLGFRTIHYFSRLFTKKTGMTPTEYRKTSSDIS